MPAAANVAAKPESRFSSSYDERTAFLFLAPLAAVLLAVAVFPILYSFYISLFSLKLTRPNRVPFVGLDNYVAVLSDPQFWLAVERTVTFSVLSVAAISVLALLIALLLNEEFPGRRVLSAVLLVPWAIPYVANALMWKWIYDSNYGALNGLLYQLDFINNYMVWLGDSDKTLALIANAFVGEEGALRALP